MKLIDFKANDGSRQFLALPESIGFDDLLDHIATLSGVTITDYVTDHRTEVWIDFDFHGHNFSVNNQMGEYWFFVKDPNCHEDFLTTIATHCATKTGTIIEA